MAIALIGQILMALKQAPPLLSHPLDPAPLSSPDHPTILLLQYPTYLAKTVASLPLSVNFEPHLALLLAPVLRLKPFL
jgi:hypothetical protein